MSGMWLPLSAVCISLFLVIIFFTKENVNNKEVKIYSSLLIANFVLCINALAVYLFAKIDGNVTIVGIMQKIHLLLLNVIAYFLLHYNATIINIPDNLKHKFHKFNIILTTIIIVIVLCVPIKVINYDEILDVGGPSYYVSLSGIILYIILLLISSIKYIIDHKKILKKSIPYIVLIGMFATGLLLRAHAPEIITETFCVSFALLVMYHTIENPDIKLLEKMELAKTQAEKANAAKTDFLSSMSHEIRTPLNAIVGFSESIEDADSLDEAKENAKDIITASQNLLEIVNGILDISKIEANKMEIINTEYDFKLEAENLVKLIKPRIGEKPIELKYYMAPDIPGVLYGDKGKIKEIMTNILTNAVKYTKEGFIDFKVSCINKNDECSLVISVEDTGRGIKPENIDKLFNKFERMEEDRNTTTEGAGLGLAITKKLVEMMGGKIIVQSVYGSGSKFTVYLKQKIITRTSTQFVNSNNDNSKLTFLDKKVLIVDDNELNIKVAETLLKKYNIKADSCESGLECIEMINNDNHYDLILMDDMMPKMTGTETLHILQEMPSFKDKTVVLTANAIEGMKEKYIEEGFDDYLAKPIEKSELERVLRKYLNKEKEQINFEPIPDSFYEISDSIVEKLNSEENKNTQ